MPRIYLNNVIRAPLERTFDLSRSIDFHVTSMQDFNEKPVGGRTSGLIEIDEYVEWEATNLMLRQRLSSKITEMKRPQYFVDEMVKGAFKSFRHKHQFIEKSPNEILVIDDFQFETPLGILGHLVNLVFLKKYVERLITSRNAAMKRTLESDEWKKFLPQ